MLEGFASAYPEIIKLEDGLIVRAKRKAPGKVGLVIGNGSGHEPAMIGLVGPGLFDVNVPGPIFTAPGPSKLAEGVKAAENGAGVLVCVSNHSGDVLNAELALEDLEDEGFTNVESVTLYDDIDSAPRGRRAERRGLGRSVLCLEDRRRLRRDRRDPGRVSKQWQSGSATTPGHCQQPLAIVRIPSPARQSATSQTARWPSALGFTARPAAARCRVTNGRRRGRHDDAACSSMIFPSPPATKFVFSSTTRGR